MATHFNDEQFRSRVSRFRSQRLGRQSLAAYSRAELANQDAEFRENIDRLTRVAREVAIAANEREETSTKKIPLYGFRAKGRLASFTRLSSAPKHDPTAQGWIIATASEGYLKSDVPDVANYTGLGLALTEDGVVHGYLARKESDIETPTLLEPINDPHNRLTTPTTVEQSLNSLAWFVDQENL